MSNPNALLSAAAGLGTGLSLIVAIGAQNAYVLRQGVRREHIGVIVAICAGSDAVLIAAGIGGLGSLISAAPAVLTAIAWGGAAFLIGYGLLAARRALRPERLSVEDGGPGAGARAEKPLAAAVLTCLALTWLNPHVYLDTVLLLGSVGNSYASGRWYFALGAAFGSVLWFGGLGFGARGLGPILAKPHAWRILDGIIAATMLTLGVAMAARG